MSTSSRRLRGFTLVELLVVITIIGMLVALLLPAIGGVRARARQAQCLNNMRQIALAMVAYESTKGKYPGYAELVRRGGRNDYATLGSPTSEGFATVNTAVNANLQNISSVSWAAILLPNLERQDYWGQIVDGGLGDGQPVIRPIEFYVCPDDTDVLSRPNLAGLTYILNTGAWDRDQSGVFLTGSGVGDTTENGVFFNAAEYQRAGQKAPALRMSSINDGAATTLMLSENIHKDYDATPQFSWFSGWSEQQLGMVWVPNDQPVPGNTLEDQEQINREDSNNFDASIPRFARPASAHGGGVNVAYCDGHGGFVREDIDYVVYQQLLTPNGRKSEDPRGHVPNTTDLPTNSPIRVFRTAQPLTEGDYQ